MKKRMNSIAVLGIVLLLFLGYAIPIAVTVFEDNHLQTEEKRFEIEAIKLQSTDINFFEELEIFSQLVDNNIVVQRGEAEEENSWSYTMVKETVEEFLLLLEEDNTVVFEKISISSVVMADWESDNVYPLWQCVAVDQNENEYMFWIDEITGKILAFDIPSTIMRVDEEGLFIIMETLAEYYGVLVYEDIIDIWYEMNGYEIGKMKNWEGLLYFLYEEEGKELFLPFYKYGGRMTFNMYPGMISVYDSMSKTL